MNLEKLAVMGQLTANLAHEIGTPLNAISGHIQLLREETGSKASRSGDRLQIISGELKRIELTVKDFLQTTAKPESQKQLVDINPTVERTLQIVFPRTQALGIDVEFVPDRRLGPLRTVPTDLQQILLNLVNNAMDSLSEKLNRRPKHRPKLRLTSRLVRDEGMDWAEITVHDNGLGIKRTDISNVMKPFFSTKTPGKGTGLGLAICQQLAARNGGAIQLDSREGTWTDAKVRFPYAKAS
jgi:signal transduction histidine kinase